MKNAESIPLFVELAKAKKFISFPEREDEGNHMKLIKLALNLIRLGSPAVNFTIIKEADKGTIKSIVEECITDYAFKGEKFNIFVESSSSAECIFVVSISCTPKKR